jgi:hypothetical protein
MSSCDLIAGSNNRYNLDSAVEPQKDTSITLHFHASWRPPREGVFNKKAKAGPLPALPSRIAICFLMQPVCNYTVMIVRTRVW